MEIYREGITPVIANDGVAVHRPLWAIYYVFSKSEFERIFSNFYFSNFLYCFDIYFLKTSKCSLRNPKKFENHIKEILIFSTSFESLSFPYKLLKFRKTSWHW